MPQIEVTFDIDANGIVNVSAKDLGTGKEQHITITASSGLAKDEVDRMMKEAEAHADEDKKRREEIEVRNRADQAVYGAERLLKDTGDKLSASDKQAIETAMEAVKKANEGTDSAAIQQALDQLTSAQHKAAESLYKQQARRRRRAAVAGAGDASGASGGPTGAGQPGAAANRRATSSTRKSWTRGSSNELVRLQIADSVADSCNSICQSESILKSAISWISTSSSVWSGARRLPTSSGPTSASLENSTRTSTPATGWRPRSSGRSRRPTKR